MTTGVNLCEQLKLQVRLPAGALILDHTDYGILNRSALGGDNTDEAPFILDKSRLDADFMGLPGDGNSEWVDLIQFVQSIDIDRGAKSTPVGSETEVGLATFVFIGPELDPNQNTLIMPGAPMRLMTANGTVVYTGTIRNVRSVEDRDGLIRVTISAHDLVGKLANIKRYGADQMTFIKRIDDLLVKHGIPYNRMGGSIDLARTDYESNLVNHLQLAVNSEQGQWWVDRQNIVQIRGTGAMETAYQTVTFRNNLFPNPGFRTGSSNWYAFGGYRVDGSGFTVPTPIATAWLPGAGPGGRPSFKVTSQGVTDSNYSWGFSTTSEPTFRPIPVGQEISVTPGQTYTVSAYLRANRAFPIRTTVYGAGGPFAASTVNAVPGQWVRLSFSFTALQNYAGAVSVQFAAWPGPGQAGDTLEISDALFEQGTVLGGWFDGEFSEVLAGDTQTVYGWYGRPNNSISYKAVGTLKPNLIRFSNVHSTDPNHACYTDIARSYDSSVIVNELKIDNYGWDSVAGDGVTTTTVYADETSRVTWGASEASMDMNIASSWPGLADTYATQILADNSKPRNQITAVVWDATNDIERAAAIEPYSYVFVEFENQYYVSNSLYKVLGVRHEISSDRWKTTLTIDEVRPT